MYCKTQSKYLSLYGTHTSETLLPISYTSQNIHSQVKHFSTNKKSTTHQIQPTGKIPIHEHLYSDQYYHINSIANPHTEKEQTKITGIMQNRNLT